MTPSIRLTEDERIALAQLANAPSSTLRASLRAQIVLACGEGSIADAARSLDVSYHTVRKWKDRFIEQGIAGLSDRPRPGRPSVAADRDSLILAQTLVPPPADRWTTRLIADELGLSQSTVHRIRLAAFPRSPLDDLPMLADRSALLAYVHIGPHHRILGLHSPATPRPTHHKRRPAALTDPLETVLCARLAADTLTQHTDIDDSASSLLQQVTAALPADRTAIVLLDFEPDTATQRWLIRNRHLNAVVIPPERWLAQLHGLARKIDDRQIPELAELQRRLRHWYQNPREPFTWSRTMHHAPSDYRSAISGYNAIARNSDSAVVMRGLYESFADGTLYPGERISERRLAQRVQRSRGSIIDTLRTLADDGLVHQDTAGQIFVPSPTQRDVTETYTARAHLGSILIRRLAASTEPLPSIVDEVFTEVVRQAHKGNSEGAGSVDLEFQDELARAAQMPRIEAMFVRLTLQIRLFVSILGLTYHYPAHDIVQDGIDLLNAIKAHDVEGAVAAWRRKVDMATRYMIDQLPK
ncbi:helix-turn-helix domain-containing protein [Rhodococcus aetherivorans]